MHLSGGKVKEWAEGMERVQEEVSLKEGPILRRLGLVVEESSTDKYRNKVRQVGRSAKSPPPRPWEPWKSHGL